MSGIGQNQLSKDVFWGITLTACLTAAALYLPIGFVIGFLIPLPLIFYRIKLGRLFSWVILCTVMAIVWMIFGKEGVRSGVFFLYFGTKSKWSALRFCLQSGYLSHQTVIPGLEFPKTGREAGIVNTHDYLPC